MLLVRQGCSWKWVLGAIQATPPSAQQQRPSVSLAWPNPQLFRQWPPRGGGGMSDTKWGFQWNQILHCHSSKSSSCRETKGFFSAFKITLVLDSRSERLIDWDKERCVKDFKGKTHSKTCRLPLLRKIALTNCLLTILLSPPPPTISVFFQQQQFTPSAAS